jgi:hypothetical protein
MAHKGKLPPQLLSYGTGREGLGQSQSILQWESGNNTEDVLGAGGTLSANNFSDGSLVFLFNCYITAAGYTAYKTGAPAVRLILGGNSGIRKDIYDTNAGLDFVSGDFVTVTTHITPPTDGYREQSLFRPTMRSSAPSFSSGDYWEGCIYYDTTLNKLRVNTGGSTWANLS